MADLTHIPEEHRDKLPEMHRDKLFLTIYTPTYRRPRLLATCVESVCTQNCQDLEHIIYHDGIGEGISGMFARLVQSADEFAGQYVYILQDDDRLSDPRVVADLKHYAEANDHPPVIICKNRKAPYVLPLRWEMEPISGHIDLGSYVVRRDIFIQYRIGLLSGRYEADFDFIRAVWDAGVPFSWYDRLIAESDQFGKGAPEL